MARWSNSTEQSMVSPNASTRLEITLLKSILTPEHEPKRLWIVRWKKNLKK